MVAIAALTAVVGKPLCGTRIKEHFGVSTRGVSVSQILTILRTAGFGAQAALVKPHACDSIKLPAIALWRANHFVVITKVGKRHVEIFDPARGWEDIDRSLLMESLTGPVVEITSVPDTPSLPLRKPLKLRGWISRYKQSRVLAPIAGVSLVAQLLTLGLPLMTKDIVDSAATPGRFPSIISAAVLLYASVALVGLLAKSISERMVAKVAAYLTAHLVDDTASRLLAKPLNYFSRHIPTVLVSKIQTVNMVQNFLIRLCANTLIQGAMSVVAFLALLWICPPIALFVIAATLLSALLDRSIMRVISANSERRFRALVEQQSAMVELCTAAQAIKLNHAAESILTGLAGKNRAASDASLKYELARRSRSDIQGTLDILERLAYLGFGAYLISSNALSFGGFVAIGLYREVAHNGLREIQDLLLEAFTLRTALGRLEDIVDPDQAEPVQWSKDTTTLAQASVAMENVTFSYSTFDAPVFKDFSLSVADGEEVAIVGASGAGKSTLAKLLLGALHPSGGSIRYGGVPLTVETEQQLLRNVASVMQSDQLLTGSIKENIDLFRGHTDEEIQRAACDAEIAEFIDTLPMRYETPISDEFAGLSGGQRQRILIARALCGSPKILIMDEATSFLDVKTERKISERIGAMKITRIIFAHRLETIENSDRVISLDGDQGNPCGGVDELRNPATRNMKTRMSLVAH